MVMHDERLSQVAIMSHNVANALNFAILRVGVEMNYF